MRLAALLVSGSLLVACVPDTPDAPDPVDASATASPEDWYAQTRVLDLTGDGTLDTLRLHARGHRSDSLTITYHAVINGHAAALDSALANARTEAFADSTLSRL